MTETRSLVLLGTLELLVLKVLELGPAHGWGLAEALESMTDGVFCVNQGSLYPALQRLKRQGLVTARWQRTENGRRANLIGDLVESGMVGINTFAISVADAPFGGVKDSGFGSEGGKEGLESYQVVKAIHQA